jgi:hypothetical protein
MGENLGNRLSGDIPNKFDGGWKIGRLVTLNNLMPAATWAMPRSNNKKDVTATKSNV